MREETSAARESTPPVRKRKPYKGLAMEGAIARWYSKTQQKSIEQYRAWARMASDHIPEGGSVLEVAPGPGYLSIEIAKLGGYKVVGLDISRTFVGIASAKAREAGVKAEFRQGDVAEMPFAEGTFDFAICTAAFKNFPEPVKALDDIFRVLKHGAEAVIVDLDKDASKADIDGFVDEMRLSWISSLMTKLAFKRTLLKWAYTKSQIEKLAAESHFGRCDLVGEGIGFEIWLRKP